MDGRMNARTYSPRALVLGVALLAPGPLLTVVGCTGENGSAEARTVTLAGESSAQETATQEIATEGPRVRRIDPSDLEEPSVTFTYPPSAETLEQGFDSPEELMNAVVRAACASDREVLQALLISRETYETVIWPHFEGEKVANTVPVDAAWGLLAMQSRAGVTDLLTEYQHVDLEFRRVTVDHVKDYVDFKLHRHPQVIVEDRETGERASLELTKDYVEIDGKFKLVAYPS